MLFTRRDKMFYMGLIFSVAMHTDTENQHVCFLKQLDIVQLVECLPNIHKHWVQSSEHGSTHL